MKKYLFVLFFGVITVISIMAQDFVHNEVQKAVKGLTSKLLRQLDVNINYITLTGTDKTSGFSAYIYPIIRIHAVRNSNSMFNVVEVRRSPKNSNEPPIGNISGTYTVRDDFVEVYLELNIDGEIRDSYYFKIPISELNGISLFPADSNSQEEAKKKDEAITLVTGAVTQENIVKQEKDNFPKIIPNIQSTNAVNTTLQSINIQAWFDSQLGSRNYMHREPLELTIMADKDCYFKVYTINANNEPPVLQYPNNADHDNRLFANRPRTIFESAKYVLYKPYGTETIWIVASTNQFENIEKEYTTPWSADTIKNSLRGNSRGELEMISGSQSFSEFGNVRFSINVLKPHDEYEYDKPVNMEEFVRLMRIDTAKERGEFNINSNIKSGYSIVNNIRISYNIPKDAPDTIEFAYYRLNELLGGQRVNAKTRGSYEPHKFEINKPRNITQTIQIVRSTIESKGGTFQGNEEKGNFKANGIEGNYEVYDKVNVTITDKPILVPNSLIEREIKIYFGGR
jgi:hypothetical protein